MLLIAIYLILSIICIIISYLTVDKNQRAEVYEVLQTLTVLEFIVGGIIILICGLPAIIYGFITGIKGDE